MPPNPCFVILKGMVWVLSVFLFSFKSRHLLKSQRRAESEIRSQRSQCLTKHNEVGRVNPTVKPMSLFSPQYIIIPVVLMMSCFHPEVQTLWWCNVAKNDIMWSCALPIEATSLTIVCKHLVEVLYNKQMLTSTCMGCFIDVFLMWGAHEQNHLTYS